MLEPRPSTFHRLRSLAASGGTLARAPGAAGLCFGICICLSGCPFGNPGAATDAMADGEEEGERLDELGASEIQKLCADLNDELTVRFGNRRLASYSCTRLYIDAGDSLTCSQAINECLLESADASPNAARPAAFQIDRAECAVLAKCSVTKSSFDTCIADRFDQTDRLITRMSCSLANDPEAVDALAREIDGPRPLPASCTAVAAECPSLFL